MRALRFRNLARRRFAWLLWLALLLPLAQVAADRHRLSHAGATAVAKNAAAADGRRDRPAPHPLSCDLCVVAAAIGGAAPPAAAPWIAPSAALHEPRRRGAVAPVAAVSTWARRSRAPPPASL